ncbi:MAG: nitroreductase [Paracoccaceae bacterium]|jgi:nitroreductase
MTINKSALEFLLTRRSHSAKGLKEPSPNWEDLQLILTAAVRSPDHGKLEPWRFLVLKRAALNRLANQASIRAAELNFSNEDISKIELFFNTPPISIAVISSPKKSEKIPNSEQILSSGAVCLALLNASLASGWGASWVTGWTSRDRPFLEKSLGLQSHESVSGYIHIGTIGSQPPERPRPDITALTTVISN